MHRWKDFLFRERDPYAMAKYEILLGWIGHLKGEKALVVGSGSGEFAALLARAGASVMAIDIDEKSIELTGETARKFGVSISTEIGRLESFAGKERFDLVAATDVIEHIEDDSSAAGQLTELTRPNGRVVITVPALPFLFGHHDRALGHFRRYTRHSLIRLFRSHIQIQHVRYYGFSMIPIALVFSRWLDRPYPVGKVKRGGWTNSLFSLEKRIWPPLGTSLLMIGSKDAREASPGR